jgi:eukaryotic-like serine/threonine-protein kinase
MPGWAVRDVFESVVELPAAEREARLRELCAGDTALLAEVRALLDAVEAGERFDDARLPGALLEATATADLAGRMIGEYRLVRRVGQGGMGDVYLAERQDGGGGNVAIKMIRPGMATSIVLRRFRQEGRILAGLRHPSIARMLDGGVSDEQPYLVMEYVNGEPITTYCEKHGLGVDDRVALFRKVCAAVQFAHSSLVVHRDLKPGNILITPAGDAKLLDFGVAKLLEQDDRLTVTQTHMGGQAFTPSYASPEQIRGEPATTACDVYSLGVVLYELLTGRLPYIVEATSLGDVLSAVATSEPTRPSDAVSLTMTQPEPVVARQHALRKKLAGDLDNIVMMAMRREPARRYASADALSEDLRRYLGKLPVSARPDTLRYRSAKFVQRYRIGLAAAALVLVAIGGGVIGTVTQAQRASTERALAVQRLASVRELANSLLFEVHDAVADLPGGLEARRLILQRGVDNLERFATEAPQDPVVKWELAEAFLRVGMVQGQPAGPSLGDLRGAERSYAYAIDIATGLTSASPQDMRARRTLALAHEKLGDVKAWSGALEEGLEHARLALSLYEAIADAHPDSVRHQRSVAISRVKLGDLTGHPHFPNLGRADEALAHYGAAYELLRRAPLSVEPDWNTRRYIALVEERMASMHRASGRLDEALAAYRHSLELRRVLSAEDVTSAEARRDVAVTQQNVCAVELLRGRHVEALPVCRAAFALYEELHAADPTNAQGRMDLAIGARSVADALRDTGQPSRALSVLERGGDALRPLLDAEPNNVRRRTELARLLAQHSLIAHGAGYPVRFAAEAVRLLAGLQADGLADRADEELLARLQAL